MPEGPQGQKRPADVIGGAERVMRIAPREETEDTSVNDGKDPAAKAMGKKGGAAGAKSLTAEQRQAIAQKAAKVRWQPPE